MFKYLWIFILVPMFIAAWVYTIYVIVKETKEAICSRKLYRTKIIIGDIFYEVVEAIFREHDLIPFWIALNVVILTAASLYSFILFLAEVKG